MSTIARRILPVIVFSQFAGTSLWFATNAVMPDLQRDWGLAPAAVGTLTSAVQFGFVCGTLVFSLLMVADRFPPTRVFLACSALGAVANGLLVLLDSTQWGLLLASRVAVGFLLAGIYPVGMKIAASWYRDGLGAALGVLIGALVLGTALPHGLRALGDVLPGWQAVVLGVSALALLGGCATAALVPEAASRPGGQPIRLRGLGVVWTRPQVRASVFGYFGHMWELYSFYVLLPLVVATRLDGTATSVTVFWVIAAGLVGCVAGGLLAQRVGSARVAFTLLAVSGGCCLAGPWMLDAPLPWFVGWLLLWGMAVAGDSPQLSTLTARNAPPEMVGSVLTFANCLGFAITIVSIELFVAAAQRLPLAAVLPWLAAGPLIGLWMLRPLLRGADAEVRPA